MDLIVEYLDSYHGRSEVIRFFEYVSQFLSGCSSNGFSKKMHLLSDQLSSCRIILRLFDDLSMLRYNLDYGLGQKESSDVQIRAFSVLSNICDQLYYPLEHIAWAEDIGILRRSKRINYWTASTIFWALSSYFSMSKSLVLAKNLHGQKSSLKLYGSEITTTGPRYQEYVRLSKFQFLAILSSLRSLLDLVKAIHYLPNGFLWAGNLKNWQIGILGTISCLISFHEHYLCVKQQ